MSEINQLVSHQTLDGGALVDTNVTESWGPALCHLTQKYNDNYSVRFLIISLSIHLSLSVSERERRRVARGEGWSSTVMVKG